MSGMNIEKIGQLVNNGSIEEFSESGRSPIQAPNPPGVDQSATGSFTNMLQESLDKANEIQLQADSAVRELAAGRNKNIHETMLMLEKADSSFRLMMQVRNKVLEAYREIMRMQA